MLAVLLNMLDPVTQAFLDSALNDATDTLHRRTVTLEVPELSLNIRQNAAAEYTPYTVENVLVKAGSDEQREGVEGAQDVMEYEFKINLKDLDAVGLVGVPRELLFKGANCYVIYNEIRHKIISVSLEQFVVRIEAREVIQQRS